MEQLEEAEPTGESVTTVSGWDASGLWKNLETTGNLQTANVLGTAQALSRNGTDGRVSGEGVALCSVPALTPPARILIPSHLSQNGEREAWLNKRKKGRM